MGVGQQYKMIFWCKNCLNTSTRPRITFDHRGYCNACVWSEKKKNIDWKKRQTILEKYFYKIKKKSNYDCIVPVSGGKDGSYVSYILKKKFNINPLTVTIRPPLELDLGNQNLKSFIKSGYDHIHLTPNAKIMRLLNFYGFKHKGFPYYGWLTAIQTAVVNLAISLNINLIVYGEDGEVEYGGFKSTRDKAFYGINYMKKIYLEGGYDKVFNKLNNKQKKESLFFKFPDSKKTKKLKITHWSYFENWDPYRNYLIAKNFCGLKENNETNLGTFTNFAQNDQALYSLHTYIMYLKFGFGRATQDAGIEIRRGAMTRSQGLNLVKLYDNKFPKEYLDVYLDYFGLNKNQFDKIIEKWVNKKLFKKIKGFWQPQFKIK